MIAKIQNNTAIITSDIDGWLFFIPCLHYIVLASPHVHSEYYLSAELGDIESEGDSILLVETSENNTSNKKCELKIKKTGNGIEIYGSKGDFIGFADEIINLILSKDFNNLKSINVSKIDSMELMISLRPNTQ